MSPFARGVIIALSVIGALAVAVFVLHEWILVKYSRAETPLQSNGATVSIPDDESSVSLPVRVKLADLNAKLNTIVPPTLSGNAKFDVNGLGNPNADYKVTRSSIDLRPDASGKIQVSVGVNVDGLFNYQILGTQQHNKYQGDATASGTLLPTLNTDWTVDPKADIHVNVQSINLSVGLGININLTGILGGKIQEQVPSILSTATQTLNNAIGLRSKVENAWNQLAQSVQVNSDPNVYLQIIPHAVSFTPLTCQPDGFVTAGAGMNAIVRTFVGQQPSPEPAPTLPNLTITASADADFHFYVPVTVALDEINRALNQELKGKFIPVENHF
jgi:hypothetical protein